MRRFISMAVAGAGAMAGMVALGGCAQGTWLKPGATPAEFAQDQARCQLYAEDATPEHYTPHSNRLGATLAAGLVDGIVTGLQQRHKSDLCMAADGWQFVPQVQVAARVPEAPVPVAPFLVAPFLVAPVLVAPGSGRGPGDAAATIIPVRAGPYERPAATVLATRPLVPWTAGSIALPPFPDEPGPDEPGR